MGLLLELPDVRHKDIIGEAMDAMHSQSRWVEGLCKWWNERPARKLSPPTKTEVSAYIAGYEQGKQDARMGLGEN